MCIFSGNPDSVSETRIFVAPCSEPDIPPIRFWFPWFGNNNNSTSSSPLVKKNGKQITVYGNTVSTSSPVAMVLPVPNKSGSPQSIEMIDTSGVDADTFFSQLKGCFPKVPKVKGLGTRSFVSMNFSADSAHLEVKRAGSYRYSIVPSTRDFNRLDQDIFSYKMTPEVKDLLCTHYHTGYSFLVCIIDQGAQYKPIAYVHDMMKGNRLFIPTRHFHGHNNNNNTSNIMTHQYSPLSHNSESDEADWDHQIYVAGISRDVEFGINAKMDNALTIVTPNAITEKCKYNLPYNEFRRQQIKRWNAKRWPNTDIILQAAA